MNKPMADGKHHDQLNTNDDQKYADQKERVRHLVKMLGNENSWQDLLNRAAGDDKVAQGHHGRTILELIQNARDSVKQSEMPTGQAAVVVGPDSVLVANTGEPFDPYDPEILKAVTGLDMSSKHQDAGTIGEKGVGMKSLLSSAEGFSIHSRKRDEHIEATFRRSESAGLLLGALCELLQKNESYRDKLEQLSTIPANLASQLGDQLNLLDHAPKWENYWPKHPSKSPLDSMDFQTTSICSPIDVLEQLPRIPLFYIPYTPEDLSFQGNADGQEWLAKCLVYGQQAPADRTLAPTLEKWLDGQKDRGGDDVGAYQTVVAVDYVDEPWQQLLDELGDCIEIWEGDRDAFDETRRKYNVSRRSDGGVADALWDECEEIGVETLILLGVLERVEFVRLAREDGQLEIAEHRSVDIDHKKPLKTSSVSDRSLKRNAVEARFRSGSDRGKYEETTPRIFAAITGRGCRGFSCRLATPMRVPWGKKSCPRPPTTSQIN